jgi:hypothetical protein
MRVSMHRLRSKIERAKGGIMYRRLGVPANQSAIGTYRTNRLQGYLKTYNCKSNFYQRRQGWLSFIMPCSHSTDKSSGGGVGIGITA